MFKSINKPLFTLSVLFNCAILIGIGSGYWSQPYTIAFILTMVGLQFLSPKFWWTTFLSIISVLLVYIPIFPRITNHGNLEIFIGLFLLFLLVYKFKSITANTFRPKNISYVFRYTLIAVYFMAGFHKLNAGFFSLSETCNLYVSNNLNTLLFGENFKPSLFLIRSSQIITIIVEMLIPFGLLHYKTRKISAWALVLFHFYLTLCGFSNFSALAGFLLTGSLINFNKIEKNYKAFKAVRLYVFFSMLAVLTSFFITRFNLVENTLIRFCNGVIFNLGWLLFFYFLITKTTYKKQKIKPTLLPFIPVLFIILWSGQAYLGLSNSGNLTMFSNLVTEANRSNHYLIDTQKTKIWGFEENLVTIIKISDKYKWEGAGTLDGYALPLIEFKTQVAKWSQKYEGPIECILIYNGQSIHVDDLKNSQFNDAKWWYPLIHYRRIALDGSNGCSW